MRMSDLAPVETWAELERFISETYGMNGRAYDEEGRTFTGRGDWCNRLCPALRRNPAALSAVCSAAHQNMTHEARVTGAPVIGECDLGLYKIVVPVFASGRLIGAVGGCGRLPEDGAVETFVAEKIGGLSAGEVADLCSGLKKMSRTEADELTASLAAKVNALPVKETTD